MRQTPPPLKPPSHHSRTDDITDQRLIRGAVVLVLISLLICFIFWAREQTSALPNDVASIPSIESSQEEAGVQHTDEIKAGERSESPSPPDPPAEQEKTTLPVGSNSDEEASVADKIPQKVDSAQEKEAGLEANLDRDGLEKLETDEDLSQYKPNATAIANANGFANFGGKVEFFGVCVSCKHVAFLIDSSGSMAGEKYMKVKSELLKSLKTMKRSHKVSIYLFKEHAIYKKEFINCSATLRQIEKIGWHLDSNTAAGGTDPTEAIQLAVRGKCDVIFLLSDGEIPQTGEEVARLNRKMKVINTIAVGGDSQSLRDVASRNQGQYRQAR